MLHPDMKEIMKVEARANTNLERMTVLLASLDRHVTISNTNVHLRSAVGQPSFVLVPFNSQQKIWMGPNYKVLWYPNVRLYRQPPELCWTEAIIQLKKDLFVIIQHQL